MIKYTVEIDEDTLIIGKYFLAVRAAIRDGSSLLFDLNPAYMAINLGNSGLATRNKIEDYHFLSKLGTQISG